MSLFLIRSLSPLRLALNITLIGAIMVAILVADTRTDYEVAAAVFYTVVILAVSRSLQRRWLIAFSAVCISLTVLSFALTPHGHFYMGLVNTGISIASIILTTFLILKMEAARTAAHEAQAQLMRIARVKSLEGLTASIAHEVNQPLAAIVTSGNACQRWLAQDPPNLDRARQALARILDDAGRASSIIARVRSLAQGAPPDRTAFDFNQAVMEVITQSQAEIDRHGIALEMDLRADLPPAFADRVQIQQVIGNLVLNAIEAMVAVTTRARIMRITSNLEDATISLSVADSGTGVPAGVQGHLFDAFWTTKPEGIGIGLSISRTIIEANGGQIRAEPIATHGAVFRFTVPYVTQGKTT